MRFLFDRFFFMLFALAVLLVKRGQFLWVVNQVLMIASQALIRSAYLD